MSDRSNGSFRIPLTWLHKKLATRAKRIARAFADHAEVTTDAIIAKVTDGQFNGWSGVDIGSDGAWLEIRVYDVGGGGYEIASELEQDHIPHRHDWDSGIEYNTGSSVFTGRTRAEVMSVNDRPVVTINEDGTVNPRELREVQIFQTLWKRLVDQAGRVDATAA